MNTLFRLMPVLHAFWKIWLSNYEIFKSSMFGAPVMDKVLPCIESPGHFKSPYSRSLQYS